MPKLKLKIHVVFYKDSDGDWVAHCLQMDLCGHGDSHAAALNMLNEALAIQIASSLEDDNPENLFSPADAKFFHMFAQGEDIAVGNLEVTIEEKYESLEFQGSEAREYSGGDLALI